MPKTKAGKDFVRRKRKVGKKLKPVNATDTTFQFKSVQLRAQDALEDQAVDLKARLAASGREDRGSIKQSGGRGAASSLPAKRKRPRQDSGQDAVAVVPPKQPPLTVQQAELVLQRLTALSKHHNASSRCEALLSLRRLVHWRGAALVSIRLRSLVGVTMPRLVDEDPGPRYAAILLIESIIEAAQKAGPAILESGMSHIVASLCSALAYLSTDVRLDALAALFLCLKAAPRAFSPPEHAERLLRGVIDLIPSTRHSAAEARSFFGLFAPDAVCVGAIAAGVAMAAKGKGVRPGDRSSLAAVPAGDEVTHQGLIAEGTQTGGVGGASSAGGASARKKARTTVDHRASANLKVRSSAAQARSWELLHSTVDLDAVLASAEAASVGAHAQDHGGQTARDSVPARVIMTPEDARIAACLVLDELLAVTKPGQGRGADGDWSSSHHHYRASSSVSASVGGGAAASREAGPPAHLLLPTLPSAAEASKSRASRGTSSTMPAGATTGVHAESAATVFTEDLAAVETAHLVGWGMQQGTDDSTSSRWLTPSFAAEAVRGLGSVWEESTDSIARAGTTTQPWHVKRLVLIAGLMHKVASASAAETVAMRALRRGGGRGSGPGSRVTGQAGLSASDLVAGCVAGRVGQAVLSPLLRMVQTARQVEQARAESESKGASAQTVSAKQITDSWRRLEGLGVHLGALLLAKQDRAWKSWPRHYQSASHTVIHAFKTAQQSQGPVDEDASSSSSSPAVAAASSKGGAAGPAAKKAVFDPDAAEAESDDEEQRGLNPLAVSKAPKGSIASFVDRARATIRAQRKKDEARRQAEELKGGSKGKGKRSSKKEKQKAAAAKRAVRQRDALKSAFGWVPRLLVSECALLEQLSKEHAMRPAIDSDDETSSSDEDEDGSSSDEDEESEAGSTGQPAPGTAGRAGWEVLAAVEHAGALVAACRRVEGVAERVLGALLLAASAADPMSSLAARCMSSGSELVRTLWKQAAGADLDGSSGVAGSSSVAMAQGAPGDSGDEDEDEDEEVEGTKVTDGGLLALAAQTGKTKLARSIAKRFARQDAKEQSRKQLRQAANARVLAQLAVVVGALAQLLGKRAARLSQLAVNAARSGNARGNSKKTPFLTPDGVVDSSCTAVIELLGDMAAQAGVGGAGQRQGLDGDHSAQQQLVSLLLAPLAAASASKQRAAGPAVFFAPGTQAKIVSAVLSTGIVDEQGEEALAFVAGTRAFSTAARTVALQGLPLKLAGQVSEAASMQPMGVRDGEAASLGGLHPLLAARVRVPLQVLLGRCVETALVMPEDPESMFAGRDVPMRSRLSVRPLTDSKASAVGDSAPCAPVAWLGDIARLKHTDPAGAVRFCSGAMLGTLLQAVHAIRDALVRASVEERAAAVKSMLAVLASGEDLSSGLPTRAGGASPPADATAQVLLASACIHAVGAAWSPPGLLTAGIEAGKPGGSATTRPDVRAALHMARWAMGPAVLVIGAACADAAASGGQGSFEDCDAMLSAALPEWMCYDYGVTGSGQQGNSAKASAAMETDETAAGSGDDEAGNGSEATAAASTGLKLGTGSSAEEEEGEKHGELAEEDELDAVPVPWVETDPEAVAAREAELRRAAMQCIDPLGKFAPVLAASLLVLRLQGAGTLSDAGDAAGGSIGMSGAPSSPATGRRTGSSSSSSKASESAVPSDAQQGVLALSALMQHCETIVLQADTNSSKEGVAATGSGKPMAAEGPRSRSSVGLALTAAAAALHSAAFRKLWWSEGTARESVDKFARAMVGKGPVGKASDAGCVRDVQAAFRGLGLDAAK